LLHVRELPDSKDHASRQVNHKARWQLPCTLVPSWIYLKELTASDFCLDNLDIAASEKDNDVVAMSDIPRHSKMT
jgi:hypothetical protein